MGNCARCGMEEEDWTGNNGAGVSLEGETYCCEGCARDRGCVCKGEAPAEKSVVEETDPAASKSFDDREKMFNQEEAGSQIEAEDHPADKELRVRGRPEPDSP